jgi:hypothetical protein
MNLKKVITEALIAKKVISDCNCGCKASEKCNKSPLINENLAPREILSEGLAYHINKKKPLTENVYRAGSENYFNLWSEARALYVRGILDAQGDDLEMLTETHIGEFGILEDGTKVPLDFPIQENIDVNYMELIHLIKTADNPRNLSIYYNSDRNVVNIGGVGYDKGELVQKFNSKPGQSSNIKNLFYKANQFAEETVEMINSMNAGVEAELKYGYGNEPFVVYKKVNALDEISLKSAGVKDAIEKLKNHFKDLGFPSLKAAIDYIKDGSIADWEEIRGELSALNEEKNKPLGKPMRDSSGGKAYKVYVKDPKTKKIKTVRFGSGGLKAKINNPKARQAFAKRHNCAQKKDKTKASYWSCRLPRYAKLLGLKSNFSGFW